MERKTDLLNILATINPADLSYTEWTEVGMALKHEGYTAEDWEDWSRRDPGRFHDGECAKKWNSFGGAASPVTGGTIVQMAMDHGWQPDYGHELDWGDSIQRSDEFTVVDPSWVEGREIQPPKRWKPVEELTRYLSTLFEPGENVGYVSQSYENDKGKYVPKDRGHWDRTAGQLIEELSRCKGDIESVIGDYSRAGGAWIRFNPLDGKGVRNENVSDFRYALVESDNMPIDRQNAILRELELPIAALVYSGGKSLHAIVRIDAADYSEYKKRVEYLYSVCAKNGMTIDTQNKNPSRLSRMPGCVRGDQKQFLVDTNIGKATWEDWKEWIESVNDDLPDFEALDDVWGHLPALAPELIEGVLRKGHKMLLAGPSKAGKSFLQIELAIAIAEGTQWLNWKCAKGRVLYVNLELDPASCLHRFANVYQALGIQPKNLKNLDIWNLRGKAVPMDKLAPKLIRRAAKRNYEAIIIDPIYKVITGDENSADQMAKFCNQFDLVCAELGCSVIYCHHHSKGRQGQKNSMDRASGSGVFARDPDAMLDMIELETNEALFKQEENKAVCTVCLQYLKEHYKGEYSLSQDDELNSGTVLSYCENVLNKWQYRALKVIVENTRTAIRKRTAWRIEGTLREFEKFPPVNVWFDYPVHRLDDSGALADIDPEEEKPVWQRASDKRKEQAKKKQESKRNAFEIAFANLEADNPLVPVQLLADELGVDSKTIGAWFGTGRRAKQDYKKAFEILTGDDNNRYLKRKNTEPL